MQSSSQKCRTVKDSSEQCGSDEVSFGKSVNCNWEDSTQLVGEGGSVAVSAKERRCRDQDECRLPEEIFQW